MEPQSQAGLGRALGKGPEEKQPKGRCLQAQTWLTDSEFKVTGKQGRLTGHRAPKDP